MVGALSWNLLDIFFKTLQEHFLAQNWSKTAISSGHSPLKLNEKKDASPTMGSTVASRDQEVEMLLLDANSD